MDRRRTDHLAVPSLARCDRSRSGRQSLPTPITHVSSILARMEGHFLGFVERFTRDRGIDETRQLELIRKHLHSFGEITNEMAQRICGIDRSRAYHLLRKLVELGELQPIGRGRNAKYLASLLS